MTWRPDPEMTELAKTVFKSKTLMAKKQQGQCLLEGTPYGLVEILSLSRNGRFLVAAEAPPRELPERELSPEIAEHLRRNGLRPWRYASADNIAHVVLDLGEPDDVAPLSDQPSRSAFLGSMASGPEIIGEDRQAIAALLAAVVSASRGGDPLAILAGPAGVGKHVMAVAVARRLNRRPQELPLARLFVPRMLRTGPETLMDVLLSIREQLTSQDLLVVSDAELFRQLPVPWQHHFGREISALPAHVLLLSTEPHTPCSLPAIGVSAIGFERKGEIAEFLASIQPDADGRFLESVRDMIAHAAMMPGFGVLPGRFRYLVDLVVGLHSQKEATRTIVTPDDAAAAVDLVKQAWFVGPADEDRDI